MFRPFINYITSSLATLVLAVIFLKKSLSTETIVISSNGDESNSVAVQEKRIAGLMNDVMVQKLDGCEAWHRNRVGTIRHRLETAVEAVEN